MQTFSQKILSIIQVIMFIVIGFTALYFFFFKTYVTGSMGEYSRSAFISTYGTLYHGTISLILISISVITFFIRNKKFYFTLAIFAFFIAVCLLSLQETNAKFDIKISGTHYKIPWQYYPPNDTGLDGVAVRVTYPDFEPIGYSKSTDVLEIYKFPTTSQYWDKNIKQFDQNCLVENCLSYNNTSGVYFKNSNFYYKVKASYRTNIVLKKTEEIERIKNSIVNKFNSLIVNQ